MTRLEHVIARNLAELRAENGVTQSWVAEMMRLHGYAWQTGRVAQIETLRRPVSVLEVVGLSRVFSQPVSRLLAGDDDIALPDGTTRRLAEVRADLAGSGDARRSGAAQHKVNVDDLRKIAKRLGRPVEDVDEAACRAFGRPLFAERDKRAGDLAGVSAESARTRRGHVTRQLVAELLGQF